MRINSLPALTFCVPKHASLPPNALRGAFAPNGPAHTAHTLYKVELVVVDERYKGRKLREGGRLADVAPTLLEMMELERPAEMTGRPLLSLE